jgi:hypothetical protein
MNQSNLTFGRPFRLGVLVLGGWMALAAIEGSSTLALFALPLLVGLWIWAAVVVHHWTRMGGNENRR